MSIIDLHMHSNYSDDGEFTPTALIEKCKKANIKITALTDHNSVKGVSEAIKAGEKYNVKVIPGVEFDCTIDQVNLHLLGYGLDTNHPIFEKIEEDIVKQEQEAADKKLVAIKELGIHFDEDKVWDLSINGVVTGEMIAEVALADVRNQNNSLLKPYFDGGARSDNPYVNFYWDYCALGKPAYTPIVYVSLEEIVKIIHEKGGVAVLAHPGKNIGQNEEIFSKIVNTDIDGVEVYSSYHDSETTQFYRDMVKKYDLFETAGSDFHGKTKPSVKLGKFNVSFDENKIYETFLNL